MEETLSKRLALIVGEDHAERGKYCGMGTNNMLEIWMGMGEIILWFAAMGNAAMDSTNVEEMSSNHPIGNIACAIMEWIGIIMFMIGALFCLFEIVMVFLEERCCRREMIKKLRRTNLDQTRRKIAPLTRIL